VATSELRRLERLRAQGHSAGSLMLISTLTILERAAGREHLPDRAEMLKIYQRLRAHDDGLPPIERTRLLAAEVWAH